MRRDTMTANEYAQFLLTKAESHGIRVWVENGAIRTEPPNKAKAFKGHEEEVFNLLALATKGQEEPAKSIFSAGELIKQKAMETLQKGDGFVYVRSDAINERVALCADGMRPESGVTPTGEVVYTMSELKELLRLKPNREFLQTIHNVKREFTGVLELDA